MSNTPPNIDFSKITFGTSSMTFNQIDKDVIRVNDMFMLVEIIKDVDTILEIVWDKIGIPREEVINGKSWGDIGVDELDTVELIMEMEKRFNCYISDDIANEVISMGPRAFLRLIQSKKRDDKLNELGI